MNNQSLSELPNILIASEIAKILRISPAKTYDLFHQKGFPTIKIGKRRVVPKDRFIKWMEQNIEASENEKVSK